MRARPVCLPTCPPCAVGRPWGSGGSVGAQPCGVEGQPGWCAVHSRRVLVLGGPGGPEAEAGQGACEVPLAVRVGGGQAGRAGAM